MASSKTVTTPLAATANTSGSTTNSSTIDNSVGYGGIAYGAMTNGGTAPTTVATANLQETPDNGSTWVTIDTCSANWAASTSTPFRFTFDLGDYKMRVQFTGNTGQSVTCSCYAVVVTGI